MIKMGVCQQYIVEGRRIKTEGTRILLCKFILTLVKAAIDEDMAACGFDQVTRTCDTSIGAMKRQLQENPP